MPTPPRPFVHPEGTPDEIFVSNLCSPRFTAFSSVTKRRGIQAYDGKGEPLHFEGWKPVFASRAELEARYPNLVLLRRMLFSMEVPACTCANRTS